jgi:hypothetical protein
MASVNTKPCMTLKSLSSKQRYGLLWLGLSALDVALTILGIRYGAQEGNVIAQMVGVTPFLIGKVWLSAGLAIWFVGRTSDRPWERWAWWACLTMAVVCGWNATVLLSSF